MGIKYGEDRRVDPDRLLQPNADSLHSCAGLYAVE
jgi:hypothetical protein